MTAVTTPEADPDQPGPATPEFGSDRPGPAMPQPGPERTVPEQVTPGQAGPTVPEQAGRAGAGPTLPGQTTAGPARPQQAGQAVSGTTGTVGPSGPEEADPGADGFSQVGGTGDIHAPATHQESPAAPPPGGAVPPSPVVPPVRSGTGAPAELFFEDLTPGRTFGLGVVRVDGDEMVAFARRFDPQWYHVDPEQAAASHHGGLIASGFYTVSLFMRAYVDHVLARAAADASPGLEELRWLAPVRAGDRLAVRLDVVGSRPSTARPGLGTVSLTGTMFRLGPDDRPDREVLRTRFRGWFTLRPTHP
ncbi:MaoC/PaaZ C-terminal domain-containing protein [Micromonospora sp. NBC_01655]|uniref:MaoC/PaaZ C-terminal domain-containing protein n=1 Tax=Micromonospora sp. NBC_01655 TaxID=2975983 RepID=UPI002259053C|nr:MaoC/PaaZ C-terminal domain-containing protein [Micromonospora sp. NBC_01655]MCX4474375.1 MaoC/PaaZ C-terminal domain-containing protein [Micromonospora sp. NBC_01655]